MNKLLKAIAISVLLPGFAFAIECDVSQSVSIQQLSGGVADSCCQIDGARRRARCFRTAKRNVKRLTPWLTEDIASSVRAALRKRGVKACSVTPAVAQTVCTASSSVTLTESTDNMLNTACSRRLRRDREQALSRVGRALRKSRGFVDPSFVAAAQSELRALRRSPQCGRGGEEPTLRCSRVVNPRDGFKVGNVYTQGEYSGQPVFVTHNGARSGRVLTSDGSFIRNLRYTGVANPDPKGLRHHYRIDQGCSSLPGNFLLEIGSTCYEINDRCGRID